MFVWPVKFIRSGGEVDRPRGCLGVDSSSSLDELLSREADNRWSGRGVEVGPPFMKRELRSCLDGDQESVREILEGESRKLAKRVTSAGMAEMVLRSPMVVSSCWKVLSMFRVKSVSSPASGVVGS